MLNITPYQAPLEIQKQLCFLQELYTAPQLVGALIHQSEKIFHDLNKPCEFIKMQHEQDEELAVYQYYACITSLYIDEQCQLLSAGLLHTV